MSSSQELSSRIRNTLSKLVPVSDVRQRRVLMDLVVAIVQQRSVALSELALGLPGAIPTQPLTQAASRVTRLRRWLSNTKIEVWTLYEPLLVHLLQDARWRLADVTVVVDGTMIFGDRLQIFRLSLLHGCRAVPLVWLVLPSKGLTTVDKLKPMFQQAAAFLAGRVRRVCLLADRGFRDWNWAALATELGWDYVIRIPYNTYVTLQTGQTSCGVRVDALGVRPGQRRYFQQVRLTQDACWATNLSVTWTPGDAKNAPELLAVISNRTANRRRLGRYARRMQIESSFTDDKSGGFDLDHTRLREPARVERLLLGVAIATLWCHELGHFCWEGGAAVWQLVDAGYSPRSGRELSLFQAGLRYLRWCLANALDRLPNFAARLIPLNWEPVVCPPPKSVR
jgi:hypothetical protein